MKFRLIHLINIFLSIKVLCSFVSFAHAADSYVFIDEFGNYKEEFLNFLVKEAGADFCSIEYSGEIVQNEWRNIPRNAIFSFCINDETESWIRLKNEYFKSMPIKLLKQKYPPEFIPEVIITNQPEVCQCPT